ncbi:hypothetical protein L1887_14551 [Cichorium endivia]|nr:hypothetical protein L1887_14551 [Cichorium endivia]
MIIAILTTLMAQTGALRYTSSTSQVVPLAELTSSNIVLITLIRLKKNVTDNGYVEYRENGREEVKERKNDVSCILESLRSLDQHIRQCAA